MNVFKYVGGKSSDNEGSFLFTRATIIFSWKIKLLFALYLCLLNSSKISILSQYFTKHLIIALIFKNMIATIIFGQPQPQVFIRDRPDPLALSIRILKCGCCCFLLLLKPTFCGDPFKLNSRCAIKNCLPTNISLHAAFECPFFQK